MTMTPIPQPSQTTPVDEGKLSYKIGRQELAAMSVYNCGSQRCTPGYQWGPGLRDHYLIHYIISGSGTYHTEGITRTVHAGEAFLVFPSTIISYVADEKTPWHYCWVGFSGIDAPLLLKKTPFTRENPIITAQNGDAIQKAFKKIWIARGYSFKDRTNMTGALYSALSLFIDHEQDAQSPSARYFNRAVDYIKGNYFFYSLSVEQIADILGITRSYLYTVFKDVCGLSPKEYITTYRINQACILLVQSEMTITSISYSIGFEDNLYFSKVFHKHMGLSPSAYRREKNEKK